MRATAPALRRRNYLIRKSHREWLARRDDDGDASGEESDDGAENAFAGRPVASSDRLPVSSGRTTRFPVVSGGNSRVVGSTSGKTVVPISTVAAEEQAVGPDGEVSSASDSDGIESGNEEDSGSDTEEETATPPPGTPPSTTTPPALPAAGRPGTIQVPPSAATTPTAPPPPPPPPPTTTAVQPPPPVLAPVKTQTPPVTTTSKASTTTAAPARTVVTGTTAGFQTLAPSDPATSPSTIADVPTQPVGTPAEQTLPPTLGSPAADVTPPSTTAQEENLGNPDNSLGAVASDQQGTNPGAAAGVVIGVLALIGIVVFGGFMWKKWRDNGKRLSALPLFSSRSEKGNGPAMAYGGAVMERDTALILAPPKPGLDKKTNSEMMDDLIQATYKAEGGYNRDSEASGTFGPKGGTAAFGEKGGPVFMNETTYTALAGPPTPLPNGPVKNWLGGIKTPHQSGAPLIREGGWPVSEYASGPPPAQPTPSLPNKQAAPWQQPELPVGKPPKPDFLPPQPAFQRDPRYTTTTTTTSTESSDVRWG